jgi:hypothetical protein
MHWFRLLALLFSLFMPLVGDARDVDSTMLVEPWPWRVGAGAGTRVAILFCALITDWVIRAGFLNLSHLPREIIIAHTMASNSPPIPPLLKADTATLAFSASKDGKLRVTYAEWDDARPCASGAMVERGAP